MESSRRDMVVRAAALAGAAWAAPAVLSTRAAAALTCNCAGFQITLSGGSYACRALSGTPADSAAGCSAINTAFTSALSASCSTWNSTCTPTSGSVASGTFTLNGADFVLTNSDRSFKVTLPPGATPLFLGGRMGGGGGGCAWLDCDLGAACCGLTSGCSTMVIDSATSMTCGGTCMTYNSGTRVFTINGTPSGFDRGISHAWVAWRSCGS